MSSNKRRFIKALSLSCGCSKPKPSDVHQPTPKPKISIYHNTNPSTSSLNSSTTSARDDEEVFTSTTFSEPDTARNITSSAKLADSIAVEKESKDPHKDFRDSMLQMIREREIYTESDLQELLECFLQLNAACHHRVIVDAFVEICEEAFPKKKQMMLRKSL
ncbi:hypothetical protein Fmac_019482 [Flemingia macrophylla]|uniref:Transcription repressor n=1 Tax=Flemingia macrophylla TaxID=520843 RepID=A0ABD1M7X5_9FABA